MSARIEVRPRPALGLVAALVLLVLAVAPRPAVAQGPEVAVDPSTVAAGDDIVVSGVVPVTGEPSCPAEDAVTLTSTSELFPPDGFGPQVTRDADGAFETTYTVPDAVSAGTYQIGLRCGGGNVGVTAELVVTAAGSNDQPSTWVVIVLVVVVAAVIAAVPVLRGRGRR